MPFSAEEKPVLVEGNRVLDLVLKVLADIHPRSEISPSTRVYDTGLVDSQAILDLIMQVERETGLEFNASDFDLEAPLTPLRLAQAFK